MFDEVHHADWSVGPTKRWIASARRTDTGWTVSAPRRVGPTEAFLEALWEESRTRRVLAGFDFPIGLPVAYGRQTGLTGFREALSAFGREAGWEAFYEVAVAPSDIAVGRPFYPRLSTKGVSRRSLTEGIGVETFTDLLRLCERRGPGRREACSVFWTLGGNQVGRAASSGWREVVVPALDRGAAIWPFDGDLHALSAVGAPILAETYPADGYAVLGAPFGPRESKRSQDDRRSKANAILGWALSAGVNLDDARETLIDGFGAASSGEDAFDAFVGLLAMIEIVEGRMPERTVRTPPDVAAWEGWILGR